MPECRECEILRELQKIFQSYECITKVEQAFFAIVEKINLLLDLHNTQNEQIRSGSKFDFELNDKIKRETSSLIKKIEDLEQELQEEKIPNLLEIIALGLKSLKKEKGWLDLVNKYNPF